MTTSRACNLDRGHKNIYKIMAGQLYGRRPLGRWSIVNGNTNLSLKIRDAWKWRSEVSFGTSGLEPSGSVITDRRMMICL